MDFIRLFILDFRRLGPIRGDRRRPDEVAGAHETEACRHPLCAVGTKGLRIGRTWG